MPALPRLPQTSPLYAPSPALLRLLETSRVVLGSASASRATILNQASVPFRVLKPNIDEKAIRFSDPVELVSALARAKAQALLDMKPECDFLIACDQVVVCDGEICEKPESKEEATERWRAYRTHHPSTVGSILVTHMPSGRQKLAVDKAVIKIKPLSDEDIQALVDEGEIMYCAGGLMVEHPLVAPNVTQIEGGIDSVLGLGMATVEDLILSVSGAED